MSAMAKMLTDMIMKELPDEIRQALTPENMEKVATGLVQKWALVETALSCINNNLGTVLTNQQEIIARLERLENDNGSNNGAIVKLTPGTDYVAIDGELGTGVSGTSPRTRRRASGD